MVSCAKGLKVNVCVVDAKNEGFQCVFTGAKEGTFLHFEDGKDLLCISPDETEAYLKACKQHQVIPVSPCSYSDHKFLCHMPDGGSSYLIPSEADNFFCLSPKDKKRLDERC